MPSKKFKNPKSKSANKIKVADDALAFQYKHPVFCFKHVSSGFKCSDGTQVEQQQAVKKLERWASMTWLEINQAPRDGAGTETIPAHAIKVSVPQVAHGRVILCTRYNGSSCRLLGFRDEQSVFNILWFDHKLQTYDH